MRLVLLGGGGFRVPTVYRALCQDFPVVPRVDEVVLYDTDRSRLDVVARVLDGLAARARSEGRPSPHVVLSTDLDDALRGADAVFVAVRVGGAAARVADERVALDRGLLGQETTGPGGIAAGLRAVPVLHRIAGRIAALAPEAIVVDFTNPAGMVTEALQSVLGARVVGVCDTPAELVVRTARAAGVDPAAVEPDYVGLNHLGWLQGLRSGDTDVLPGLLADPDRLAGLEEADVFGADSLRAAGRIPNEYLWYWYRNREAVHALTTAARTRGEVLRQQQDTFYDSVTADPSDAAARWARTLDARSAGYMAEARTAAGGTAATVDGLADERAPGLPDGYAGVALAVLAASAGGPVARLVLNVANNGTVPALPDEAVIEVPAVVDADGVRPVALRTQPDLHQLGLMASVKAAEQLTIEAALTGSAELAERAFATHPMVDSTSSAKVLLAGYRGRIPGVDAVFTR